MRWYSQDLKKQLNDERDNLRRVTLQREIEVKELRATLDKNVSRLSLSSRLVLTEP